MNEYWQLETKGKPLESVHNFFSLLWDAANLDAMMIPLKTAGGRNWQREVISSKKDLTRSNPFTPIMVENIAQFVPQFIYENQNKMLAVLLRPCEVRALQKITEKAAVDLENLIIISSDCLGTFPEDEFSWRANRKGSQENLAEESIRFSRQGGIAPYRYRAACQLCTNPIANEADININIVGMPIRQKIMISIPSGISESQDVGRILRKNASNELVSQHNTTSAKLIFRNEQTKTRLSEVLVENTSLDLESLVDQLNDCGECSICMDVCPICTTHQFSRDENGKLSREVVADWMISCVGCGMCEQSCSQHKPLAVLFSIINDQLNEINNTIMH
jgi:formate dehydrogenase subunit beta